MFAEKNQGYNTLQHYTCAIHPTEGTRYFLAGAQDNGSFRYDEENDPIDIFDNISYGDGTFCFIDEDDPDFQISSSQFNYLYTTNTHLSEGYMFATGISSYGIFNNPMDFDNSKNILYANNCNFYGDGADILLRIYNLKTDNVNVVKIPMNTGTKVPFSAIKVAKINSGTVFVGTQNGKLFKLENREIYCAIKGETV